MKKNMAFVLAIFNIYLFCYAQSTIVLEEPVYEKMFYAGPRKVFIDTDNLGRIVKIQRENEKEYAFLEYGSEIYYHQIDSENKIDNKTKIDNLELNLNKNSKSLEFIMQGRNLKYNNGILISYKEEEPVGFYIYRNKDDFFECRYSNVTFGDVSSYDYEYTFLKKDVNAIRSKSDEINKINAFILIKSNFEVLAPILSSIDDYNVSPSIYLASSELKEKNASYFAENLRTLKDLPWASANGFGIDDIITIKTPTYAGMKLAFYNGYQSDKRPDLYKANSRVKKVRIKNLESGSSKEFILKDTPEVQNLSMYDLNLWYNVYTSFEITILEVYPGEKYKDLCIQAIIPIY